MDTVERPRVYFDTNAGAWCYYLPGRLPVQAESWQAAIDAVTPPATPTELRLRGPITPGDPVVPVVRWWHRLVLP